jgi:hypothetical protein
MCHRLEPDNSGANIANLPSLVVFGALVRPQHALMLAAAVVMFGWRGLLVGGILCKRRLPCTCLGGHLSVRSPPLLHCCF